MNSCPGRLTGTDPGSFISETDRFTASPLHRFTASPLHRFGTDGSPLPGCRIGRGANNFYFI